ncbi:MAG: sigma-54 dependent transcriptional regulator [Candidatus Eisenbacteria bacterium]|nr:sigma-54 dependent transcriptional regulator [Candidatus Eisenbacteria bacterium]
MNRAKILIVDDEPSAREFLSVLLGKEGHEVKQSSSAEGALGRLKDDSFDLIIADLKMSGMDGIDLLSRVKKMDPSVPVIIMTGHASQRSAIDALNLGAFQYLEKDWRGDEIKLVVRNALQMRRIQRENVLLKKELKRGHEERETIGKSDGMRDVFKMVEKVADTDSTILICGESGTGKELIAREIHYRSQRANSSFVSINCGALPKDLLESNLFGHVKGSFTGAVKDNAGLLVVAEGGTFFLDEVGETLPATQVKLLRALQEREIIPVGGLSPIKIDVRLIAATNADLEKQIAEGRFRADLYYRLNVIQIRLPPLRERSDDIPLLINHFLKKLCGKGEPKTLSKEAHELLLRYHWPGNVRELENVIERAIILSEADEITPQDLPDRLREKRDSMPGLLIGPPTMTLEELEKQYIMKVLECTKNRKKRASEILGINPSTLYRKLVSYGLISESKEKVLVEQW